MAWTAISSTQTDSASPLDQTVMDAIRTNLDDLNTRMNAIGIVSDSNIHDEFTADSINTQGALGTDPCTWDLGGGTIPVVSANPDHYALCSATGANDWSVLAASPFKMRVDLSRDHTVAYEVRHKSAQSDINEYWTFGFQDASLAHTVSNIITDRSDFIGFIQATGAANKYRAQTDSGGAGPTIVVNDYGDASVWNILRIEVTFAGATQKAEFFVNGTSVGSSTTNLPIVRLRPVFGNYIVAGVTRNQYADYIDAYHAVRPLST